MDNTMFILFCAVMLVSALFSLIKQFQMLQQNSYFPSRYFKWISDSYFNSLIVLTVVFCLISVSFGLNIYLSFALAVIFAVLRIISAIKEHKKSIKKLVFTKRIWRLFGAAFLLLVIIFAVSNCASALVKGIFFGLLLFLSVFTPVLVFAAYYITYPIEKAFNNYYISDAKKIIAAHGGLTVVGVTGSYGKTGTKFILQKLLSEKFNVLATPQSFNTPLGVVRTIREKLKPATQIFVCEMGAKNIGDIKEICDIVNPTVGIITSVGPQHLETFKTTDNVFKTKFELYDACKQNGGRVFVNTESEVIKNNLEGKSCVTYGFKDSDVMAQNITYSESGAEFDIVVGNTTIPVKTKLLGRHNVLNITGAAAIALSLGVTPEDIRFAVSRLEPTEHRLELKSYINGSVVLDDAYNANPEGCIEAVSVLSCFNNKKKVIITPGLVELGEKEYDFNYKLGLAAAQVCDIIILVGKNRSIPLSDAINTTAFNKENLFVVSSFAEALKVYTQFADSNTALLIENDLPDNYLN